ncbi:MAG: hypothetical protein IRY83_03570 [Chloroflexi bacterium]|nr:hypothetical protein [Chloroflexota bacterium]
MYRPLRCRTALPRLFLTALLSVLFLSLAASAHAANGPDYAIPGGWFFTEAGGGGGQGYAVRDTGTDARGQTIRFWSEFRRLGGVATLGYPIGEPYVGADGFTYQPFQRALLQWRPEQGRAVLANTFEMLQSAGKDDWLLAVKGIPRPIPDDGSGGDFARAVQIRLGWLTNEAIRAKFLANPNPAQIQNWGLAQAIELYGLPMSRPEAHGPFISQRFQRVAFQLWTVAVPGMPAPGTVVAVLGGDLLKEAGLLPSAGGAGPSASTTPAPRPTVSSYPWYVASIQGWPNCGTTYIRAYTRDANGNGVNGMTLKSWNDWGNEYIASTRSYNGKDGYWDRVIGPGVRPGRWYVVLVDGAGHQASDVATVTFTASCEPGQGNVQEAEIEFRAR